MKERPILFSSSMVRALLAGTKTQTRRIVKWRGLQPGLNRRVERSGSNWVLVSPTRTSFEYRSVPMPCPYGQSGDRLWVRETWAPDPPIDDTWASTAWSGCGRTVSEIPERFRHPAFCLYAADWLHGPIRWTPSIHMPRWASRITLEITGVRAERLGELSEADAQAEGVASVAEFIDLWTSINSSWEPETWVWVVEFRSVSTQRVRTEGDRRPSVDAAQES